VEPFGGIDMSHVGGYDFIVLSGGHEFSSSREGKIRKEKSIAPRERRPVLSGDSEALS